MTHHLVWVSNLDNSLHSCNNEILDIEVRRNNYTDAVNIYTKLIHAFIRE